MKKPRIKKFAFSEVFLGGKTFKPSDNLPFDLSKNHINWKKDITRAQKREVLNVLKETFKDNIEYKNKHYIPSRNEYCETYTKYSNFRWSKNFPSMLYCSTETVLISKDKMLVDRDTEFIDPDFNCILVNGIDALQELRSKLITIIERIDFSQIPIMV